MEVRDTRSKDLGGVSFLIWRYLLCDSSVDKQRALFSYLPKKKTHGLSGKQNWSELYVEYF